MTFTTLMQGAQQDGGLMGLMWPIALMVGVMYFIVIRPQKKREKAVQEMRSKVEVGDNITTVGGIIGIVVKVSDDALVIESSADRTKVRIAKWAVQANNTAREAQVKAAQEAAASAPKKKGLFGKSESAPAAEAAAEPKSDAESK